MPPASTVAIVSFLLGAATPPQPRLDEAFLDAIEARVVLPPEARPLASYARSYFRMPGGVKLMGVYSALDPPGRRWVESHPGPYVMDGGCAVVTVVIDVKSAMIDSVECNGVG